MCKHSSCLVRWVLLLSFAMTITACVSFAVEPKDALEQGFVQPPRSARPRVYWWWLESNISKAGITRDLEEMKDKGIGGALIFDAASGVKGTPSSPGFMGPEWREMFKHTLSEANRLGLEISVNLCSGWDAGGPWITPEYSCQKLVWSETKLAGPLKFSGTLPVGAGVAKDSDGKLIYYQDIAVQAFKVPDSNTKSINGVKHWKIKSANEGIEDSRVRGKGVSLEFLSEQEPEVPGEAVIESSSIVNLSGKMDRNGRLIWDVPEGNWSILRFGHTITGKKVSFASPGGRGYEIDFLSAEAMDLQFESMAKKLIEDAGELAGKTLKYFHDDSWEIGSPNWTRQFGEEFKKYRGYDMTPYLPVLAGKIVDSREVSNRFLYDFRRTIADCIAENHYGRFRELCNSYGIGYHAEAGGPFWQIIPGIDTLKCLGRTDIPMGEFWQSSHWKVEGQDAAGKQTASAAHIYGKKLVNAEAFTSLGSHWETDLFDLKPTADRALCAGINRFFMHTFTHSPPQAGKPGYEYFAGTHFNPNVTWWEQAGAFTDYVSRCQFLLQQGLFVGDVCYYYGDNVPNFAPPKHVDSSLGVGYDYDTTNSEVILTRMSVKDGRIVLPDGMSYRILVLPDYETMPPKLLRKIADLVKAGATVVGPKPSRAPGLNDYPDSNRTVKKLADELWGPCDGRMGMERRFGKGRIIRGKTLREILLADGVKPDFSYTSSQPQSYLDYIHRTTGEAEIYFVANRKNRWEETECTFRVSGKTPELWDPATGKMSEQVLFETADGQTKVPLRLAPYGSVFVVFRKETDNNPIVSLVRNGEMIFPVMPKKVDAFPAIEVLGRKGDAIELKVWQPGRYVFKESQGRAVKLNVETVPDVQQITGPWEIHFTKGWGAPESAVFEELMSWSENPDSGIKYFSGTAVYRKEFNIPKALTKDKYLSLDLGKVKNIAEVTLNGRSLGILWKQPFRVDITEAVKPGKNLLEVEVTNLWPNRLIGDQHLPKEKRFTNTNIRKFKKDSALMESGLRGPVQIIAAQRTTVQL